MAKRTTAELQLSLSVYGLHYATSLTEALKRVGGAAIRRNLDEQAKSILGIDSALQKTGKTAGNIQGAMQKVGATGGGFGNFLKVAARGTIVAQGVYRGFKMVGSAIADSLEPLAEFEHNMARVRAKGQLSAAEAKTAGDAVKAMTGITQFTPTEMSTAAVGLAAAGKAKTLGTDLPTMLRFAQANDVAPDKATEILLGVSGQMGMQKPGDLERIGNMMTKADQLSVLNVNEIYDTMKYVGPLARDAGVSLQGVLSMVVSLGDAGIKASKAGTGLRNLLSAIAAPPRRAKQAQKELDKIHLTREDMRAGFENIPKFLRDLDTRFEKYKISKSERIAIEKIMFGQYGMTATSALLGDSRLDESGVSNIQKNRDALADVNNLMRDQADLMGETFQGKLAKVNAQWELLKITMGEVAIDNLKGGLDALGTFLKSGQADLLAKNLGGVIELLGKTMPAAIAGATTAIELLNKAADNFTLAYGGGHGFTGTREVSPDDEAAARESYAQNAADNAGRRGQDPYQAKQAAYKTWDEREAKLRAAGKRGARDTARTARWASMTPEERAAELRRQGDLLTPPGSESRPEPTPIAAPSTPDPTAGRYNQTAVNISVALSDDLKGAITKLTGGGPGISVGATSQ